MTQSMTWLNNFSAQDCNADRIELCANLTEGGTTPVSA